MTDFPRPAARPDPDRFYATAVWREDTGEHAITVTAPSRDDLADAVRRIRARYSGRAGFTIDAWQVIDLDGRRYAQPLNRPAPTELVDPVATARAHLRAVQ